MDVLLERNRKFHEAQRKLREQGHLAKGAVTLCEQIDVVIKQLGSEKTLLDHTPKLISFKVRCKPQFFRMMTERNRIFDVKIQKHIEIFQDGPSMLPLGSLYSEQCHEVCPIRVDTQFDRFS